MKGKDGRHERDDGKGSAAGQSGHTPGCARLLRRERHRKRVLDETVLVPFEQYAFHAMKGYDEALREKYGDYMRLPPEEKRTRGHGFNKSYWK